MSTSLTTKQFYARISSLILGLAVAVSILFALELFLPPAVKSTNLQEQQDPSQLETIELSFNRPMDRRSVEQAFSIEPPRNGTFSWQRNKLLFQLEEPLPYSKNLTLTIQPSAKDVDGRPLSQAFTQSVQTAPLQILYIGTSGDETERLVLHNLETNQKQILTEPQFTIEQFAPLPGSQTILMLGAHPNQHNELYRLDLETKNLTQITSGPEHLNKSFTISPTGEYIALSRTQTWLAPTSSFNFTNFLAGTTRSSDVFFSSDGSHLLYLNENYTHALAPIDTLDPKEALLIGKEFDRAFGFHPLQPILLFNKLNSGDPFDITNSLVLFYGDGSQEELPFTPGITRDSTFTPDGNSVITIFSGQDEVFDDPLSLYPLRIFHLYAYNLETKQIQQLTTDPTFSEEDPQISPNSQYILFRRFPVNSPEVIIDPAYRDVADSLSTVSTGELWLYDLRTGDTTNLEIPGRAAQFF